MITIIKTNVSKKRDAIMLGKKLLDDNLVVCSSFNKIVSQYFWKGMYHQEKEYEVVFKTGIAKKSQAIKCINKIHPYDVPMIASKNYEINNSYKAWMDQSIG